MTIYNGLNRDNIGITLVKIKPYSCFKLFFIFLLLCHLLGTPPLTNASQEEQDTQRVLIVNSYHPGYTWSDDIMLGIRDVLGKQKNVELIIEYLDTKRHFEKSYFQQIKELFRQKYKSADIDLVITSDDNALDFILSIRKELFPDIPLIFCGIDHIEPERIANQETVYGIEEADSTLSTINLIQSIHPDIESITFIADETSTGKLMIDKVRQIESTHQNKIHFQYIIGMSVEELQSTLKNIPDNTVIFYLSFIRDKNGKILSIKDSMQLIADSANVPVYCSWGFQPETGVLGGNVLSGYKQGEISAKVGRRLLDGNSVEKIPVKQQAPLVYKFDYHAMNRFNIDEGILPQNSVIYNRPSSLYSEHKKLIWSTLFVILCLLAFIILLFLNIERRKKAETELRKAHGNLDQKVKIRTDELTKSNELLNEEINDRKRAEEALRESEGKYRGLVEGLDEAMYRMSLSDGKYEYMSPAARKVFGYSAEEFMENPLIIGKLMHPDFVEYFEEKWADLIEGKVSPTYKYKILDPEGNERWIVQSNTGIFDDSGNMIGIEGLSRDITKGVRAEEALRESEGKFRSFAEQSLVGIYLISGDVFKYVNPKFAEIFGYSVDECLDNMHFPQLVHPEDLATVKKQVSKRLSEETKAVRYSFRGIKKSGETIHVEIFGSSILLKDNTVATGTMLDITESKRAQEALRESEEKFRVLFEFAPDAYYLSSLQGAFIGGNRAAEELLGYKEEEMIGKNFFELNLLTPDQLPKAAELLGRNLVGKETGPDEFILNRKNGETVVVEIRTLPTEIDGQDIVLGIARDVSERKELETSLHKAQRMEAIGTLAGGVAHDLNNILGGLVSYPELLLLQLPENSPLRKSILTIQKSGEKAAAVVQDLLTLARRGVVVTDVVNLNEVISEYLKSPEHETLQSYHPGVHLETHLEKDTLNILGSSTHLSKTVMNLVSNAAEAMPEGGALTVSTENRHIDRPIRGYDDVKEGDYVILTIADTGTGISPDDIEKIFEPFYTKKKMGRSGTGLGMAVVWGTVKDHNGYIDVQSTEGKGTTFTLYFPVTRKQLPEDESSLAIESYSGNGESVLVIDDVEEQRKIAAGMLEELGYSVVPVSSGEDAVEYLKTNKADLLLLDMIMDPGMDGLDTYKKIIEIHPGQKAIIASGFSETDRVKELQSLGAGAYIRKPFLMAKVGLAVKEELEK